MKKVVLALIFFSLRFSISAQEPAMLPIGFAPGEELLMDSYLNNAMDAGTNRTIINTPPTLPVRTAAQWEEVQALIITWTGFPSIHRQIITAAQSQCKVIIHCKDSMVVKSDLTINGVSLSNLKFIEVPFNSIWIRDYAANTCYLNNVDSLILVDWLYNRPRPDDDQIPVAYSSALNIPLYRTTVSPNNLMNTGGNWMVDGIETAFASKLILDENDGAGSFSLSYPNHTESEINKLISEFQGINRYIKMVVLPYDGIHHIDMHMKLLDEKTILVGEFPSGISDGPQLEANLLYVLNNFKDPWGNSYKIVRVPMPPSTSGAFAPSASYRTYSNFVIANKTIIMPVYREEFDTIAVRVVKENMPGYNIVTIDSDNSSANLISMGGVIHCITHTVGVSDPLRIVHNSLEDSYNSITPYQVDAIIQHKTDISNAKLYWATDTTLPYNSVSMTLTNASTDTWTGFIPAQPVGTIVYYYIQGQANSGKQQVRPITAPKGWWKFKVIGTTGVEDNLSNLFSNSLFPNPSKGITCIPVRTGRKLDGHLYVTDIAGRVIHSVYSGAFKQGESKYFIDTNSWDAGVYVVIADTNEGQITQKLMIR